MGSVARLDKQDAQHAIRVLRLKVGDEIEVMDGSKRCRAQIAALEGSDVQVQITQDLPTNEPSMQITLFQGLPKAEKMEFILQKCTELGIFAVQPIIMARCVAQSKEKNAEKKQERWQKIVREATKQCARATVPQVHMPLTLSKAKDALAQMDLLLVPWEDAKSGAIRELTKTMHGKRIGLVIGPEGGIAPEEIEQLEALGAHSVTLGPRILRTETAGMAALTMILAFAGEME